MAGGSARLAVDHGVHAVQFYGDDGELSASVGRFLEEGLDQDCPAIVVATPAHRAAFGAELQERADVGGATYAADRLLMVDAAGMLRGFLAGGRIDPAGFQEAAAGLVASVAGTGQPVRIYAEMVALLWDAGQVTLALELEALWNDLASRLSFSLLCGYPARLTTAVEDAAALEHVCRLHSAIAGPYPHLSGAAGMSLDEGAAVRSFPRDRESARQARHFVLDQLSMQVNQQVAADAEIVTAELAANAVLHARSRFTVAVSRSAGSVRISVRDEMPLEEGRPLAGRKGHGLDLMAQLAARWAVEQLPGGKVIWAELPAAP
ncbi:MAG TPA: MEDS domain-containing protein [Streptosporangiaceae bacterium]|nr:MEDS domain-containing protein [Streptosporangiaceae bacterium]